jgi:hypothetical protein
MSALGATCWSPFRSLASRTSFFNCPFSRGPSWTTFPVIPLTIELLFYISNCRHFSGTGQLKRAFNERNREPAAMVPSTYCRRNNAIPLETKLKAALEVNVALRVEAEWLIAAYVALETGKAAIINELIMLFDGPQQRETNRWRMRPWPRIKELLHRDLAEGDSLRAIAV